MSVTKHSNACGSGCVHLTADADNSSQDLSCELMNILHLSTLNNIIKTKLTSDFLFVVKVTATEQQKSKFCPQIQHTEARYHIHTSYWLVINEKLKTKVCFLLIILQFY